LYYIFLYSFLLPVIVYVIFFKKVKKETVGNILVIYSVLFFLLNFIFDSIPKDYIKTYYFSYTFFEYLSFASLLFLKTEGKNFRRIILITSAIFIVFQIYYYIAGNQRVLDSVPIGIATILVFIFIINYFLQEFKTVKDHFIYTNFMFWICVGIMVYLGLSFFFNIMADHLKDNNITKYWEITYIFDIVKNGLFGWGIIALTKQASPKSKKSTSLPYLDMV